MKECLSMKLFNVLLYLIILNIITIPISSSSEEEINFNCSIYNKTHFVFCTPSSTNKTDEFYDNYEEIVMKNIKFDYESYINYFNSRLLIQQENSNKYFYFVFFENNEIEGIAKTEFQTNQMKFNSSYFERFTNFKDRDFELKYASVHEFTHLIQQNQYNSSHNSSLPKWITEGVANYVPYKVSNINILTSNNKENWTNFINYLNEDDSAILSLKGVNKTINNKKTSPLYDSFNSTNISLISLAYVESFTTFYYIDSVYGSEKTQEFILEINKSENYHEAFNKTFNITLQEFEIRWQESLKNQTLRNKIYGNYMKDNKLMEEDKTSKKSPGFNLVMSLIILSILKKYMPSKSWIKLSN